MAHPIRILAPAKEVGDLFNRLVSDLFLALGYDQPRLNIHKSGREIDVDARHRLENRRVLAECKATRVPIGGGDVNKFAGVLDVERRRSDGKIDLGGYFVSLSGFTESAIEQEKEFGDRPRLILLNGSQVVDELIKGRIVASRERALEQAGRCVTNSDTDLVPEGNPELLAHASGWVWALRYRRQAELTHVALVHADGFPLPISGSLAGQILAADRKAKGNLFRLTYLDPPGSEPGAEEKLAKARDLYFRYLAGECGEIELDGLPADHDIGTRRLRLESLFVPLHIERARPEQKTDSAPTEDARGLDPRTADPMGTSWRLLVGSVLAKQNHLAILALPGGGKSTLLKRLAVAYAFPDRRGEIGDDLPNRPWFPLFIRCRQIENRATEPILQLLSELGERAELGDQILDFRRVVLSNVREGTALLLIDGLDEIADPGARMAFVHQLRTFLSTYPGVGVVATSREAGFRLVAGSLSAHCDHYRIADFDHLDIERLTVAWHREVFGLKPEVETQARALAASIWDTDRVRRLAVNPLLLTTLLLVRRWVGQIPSKRSVLYEKAIEVLLLTWNVEGFEPLDVGEVKPQLAFLAWQMMEDEVQQVSEPRLREILQEARRQMPEVLAYAKLSVGEFVDRVERRSGLLVQSGQRIEGGRLVSVYEFRHLTFQEYLAAWGLVEGHYPCRSDRDTLDSKLRSHFEQESWKEVVPLAAVLAGRRATPLIEALVGELDKRDLSQLNTAKGRWESGRSSILVQCLIDEAQIAPTLADRALETLARLGFGDPSYPGSPASRLAALAGGRYWPRLKEIVWQALSTSDRDLLDLGGSWLAIGLIESRRSSRASGFDYVAEALALYQSAEPRNCAFALLLMMRVGHTDWARTGERYLELIALAKNSIVSDKLWEKFLASWALAWLMMHKENIDEVEGEDLTRRLLNLWLEAECPDLAYVTGWTLQRLPVLSRSDHHFQAAGIGALEAIRERFDSRESGVRGFTERLAALLAAFYIGGVWTDAEIVDRLLSIARDSKGGLVGFQQSPLVLDMLGHLGNAGEETLWRLLETGGFRSPSSKEMLAKTTPKKRP